MQDSTSLEEKMPDQVAEGNYEVKEMLKKYMIDSFGKVVYSEDFAKGVASLVQSTGMGAFEPNCILAQWPKDVLDLGREGVEKRAKLVHMVQISAIFQKVMILTKGLEWREFEERLTGNIDIWWIVGGGGVLLLLPSLLEKHKIWSGCHIRLFVLADRAGDDVDQTQRELDTYVRDFRLKIKVFIKVVDDVVAGMSRSNLEPLPDDSVPTEHELEAGPATNDLPKRVTSGAGLQETLSRWRSRQQFQRERSFDSRVSGDAGLEHGASGPEHHPNSGNTGVGSWSMRHLAWYKERHFPERLAQWASDPPMLTAEDCPSAEGRVFTIWSQILWHSDGESKLLCYEPLPQCSDGLLLKPVPIWDCPPVNEVLPGCHTAAPGDLCEGDGAACGTRDDINSCYDANFTYPSLRDVCSQSCSEICRAKVYRKEDGTTRTTSTTHSLTLTTKTSKAVMLWSSKDGWQYVGPVQNNCISSPEIPGQCTAIPPVGMPIKLVSYSSSDSGESLKIDHQESHPSDPGHSYLVGSERSRSSVASSWEFCAHEAICTDGLTLTPVTPAECPSSEDLPGCAAEPGDFWKAGECCTSDQLANCEGDAVYQKATGTTRTSTTSATRTATSTASLWQVEGPCSVSGACAESPNFPEPYGFDERCTLTLPEGTVVTVTSFETEDFYDKLTINGEEYSGTHGLEGISFVVTSPIEWRSDESNVAGGWQICLGEVQPTTISTTITSFMV